MFKNKIDGKNNMCGENIARIRMQMKPKCSQRKLADLLQLEGIDVDKNAIQRIECGKRFITDIELFAFQKVLDVPFEELFINPDE